MKQLEALHGVNLDLDNDGDLDLLVANGRVKRATRDDKSQPDKSVPEFWKIYAEGNHVFCNDGSGRFKRYENPADPMVSRVEVSRGLATGDIDNDGDVDVVISNTAGPVRVLINNQNRPGQSSGEAHWLIVQAELAARGGRMALGAQVTVVAGDSAFVRLVQPATSFLSSSDPRPHFGLGTAERVDSIRVMWPDGTHESFAGGEVDRIVIIRKGDGRSVSAGAGA